MYGGTCGVGREGVGVCVCVMCGGRGVCVWVCIVQCVGEGVCVCMGVYCTVCSEGVCMCVWVCKCTRVCQ